MPKFFVFSDVHGFYDELMTALNDAGYDKENPDHYLISCGDNWDRGEKPVEIMQFLMNSPRCILVRGNHEDLFEEMCDYGFPQMHDKHNGTDTTVKILSGINTFPAACDSALEIAKPFFNKMKNYYETKNYIFVHGWITVNVRDSFPDYYAKNRNFEYNPNWRECHTKDWETARWICGIEAARQEILEPNKTIVCGHWNCSYGHYLEKLSNKEIDEEMMWKNNDYYQYGEGADFNPYYSNGIIAIDTCTVVSHKVNILVIEDDFLEESD